ncbi:serine hydrolase domain-containing protein [Luteitalea sp.]|jgi:CubicO group peptidase (beta-lactamase class C family)|uniref:serine hydrolase domain-containing protein n=1 Tax=Luteitalea sp. TaxID=2004800 RepID=UPI0037CC3DE2
MVRKGVLSFGLWVAVAGLAGAQGLPAGAPEQSGMAADRLARITGAMQGLVDQGRVAGTVTLVARNGKVVYHEAAGRRDVEKNVPMTTDTLFRIASMSKAVTSVAVMMLVEEGKVHLDDPVSRFIPSFAKTTVVVPPTAGALTAGNAGTAPAARPITIRHLLTHTAGISYGNGNPFEADYRAASVIGWYFADKDEPIGATIDRLAKLPMDSQPGDKYVYGFNTDILGVVVEKASGLSLADFMRTRIFEPLKMANTQFYVDPAKADRLATVYSMPKAGGSLERAPEPGMGQGHYVNGPRKSYSGGAGLVSTAIDYARFLQMLLNGGALDGARLLSPKTVELMTSNHAGTLYSNGNFGFGLGFEITEHVGRSGRPGSVGEYGWGGAYHTKFWVDPVEKMVVVFMTQLLPAAGSDAHMTLRQLVYGAIVDAPNATVAKVALRPAS